MVTRFCYPSCLLLFLLGSACLGNSRRPNIIFILTDDLGYADVSCYGAEGVQTPNIDRMASQGIRFVDFSTAASICSPSRAAFLTGGYPQRAGLYMGINPNRTAHWFLGLHPNEITLAEHLKANGYTTQMVGKWHLGTEPEFLPMTQGFDHYYGMPCNFSHSPEFYDDDEVVFAKTPLGRLTRLYTQRVTEFIRAQATRDQSFFLYYAHNYPHTPFQAGPDFKGTSRDGVRGDVIQELDWSIGELVSALKATGQYDNTLIVFTSDNGPTANRYARPFRGTKYVTLEGGHRVPFIVQWPAVVKPNQVSGARVNAMDLFPTISDMIGADLPTDRVYDGISLLQHFQGKPLRRDNDVPFFYYNCENLQAIRQGRWKLHLPRNQQQLPFWEKNKSLTKLEKPILYDLESDHGEVTDIAASNPDVVRHLLGLAESARQELGEFKRRGKGQRPTGSIFPAGPVVSHPRDWIEVSEEMDQAISTERRKRHPGKGRKRKP